MFNVDTLTLGINLEDKLISYTNLVGNVSMVIDYDFIKKIENKLKQKLYLDNSNREKLRKKQQRKKNAIDIMYEMNHKNFRKDYIYWYGSDNGYGFCYNDTRHVLSVTLSHYNVENYTSKEILEKYENVENNVEENIEKPNIIVIVNESFCDYYNLYKKGNTNPIEYFTKLSKDENVVSGVVYSSEFGGQTSNVEYEFLTQNSTNILPVSESIPFSLIPSPSHFKLIPTSSKAYVQNSRTVLISPVAITKSSGLSCCKINHIHST